MYIIIMGTIDMSIQIIGPRPNNTFYVMPHCLLDRHNDLDTLNVDKVVMTFINSTKLLSQFINLRKQIFLNLDKSP